MGRILKGRLAMLVVCAGAAATLPLAEPARAETPPNVLVMGQTIDGIITLDPAEVFEFTAAEIMNNVYDRITTYEPGEFDTLVGGAVKDWTVSDDGNAIDFTMRDGMTFHSGNPVRAEDAVFSLRRVIKLNKTPAFIFTQFGWTPDNVDEMVRTTGDGTFRIRIPADLSPGLVLNALSATVGSVVDKKLVMEHAQDGDMGYNWLKTASAGSGPYEIQAWNANENVLLNSYPDYWKGAPAMERVILRHVPEPAAQRLLLEQGDIDIARTLTPDQIDGLEGQDDIVVESNPKSTMLYMAMNDSHEILGKPKVQDAMRWLVDYQGMADSFLAGQAQVQQSFWPDGLWASIDDNPYSLDVEKAKSLLEEAGEGDGFDVTIDTINNPPYTTIAQSLQETFGQAGIDAEITLQDASALWPKYRARRHEIIIARWGPDYLDPHSNADSFAYDPDKSKGAQLTGKLAWRNAWADEEMNELTVKASQESDRDKRAALYDKLLHMHQKDSPFVLMFQQTEQIARDADVKNFVSGPSFDLVFYDTVTKE